MLGARSLRRFVTLEDHSRAGNVSRHATSAGDARAQPTANAAVIVSALNVKVDTVKSTLRRLTEAGRIFVTGSTRNALREVVGEGSRGGPTGSGARVVRRG